jgi:hypothetical protein
MPVGGLLHSFTSRLGAATAGTLTMTIAANMEARTKCVLCGDSAEQTGALTSGAVKPPVMSNLLVTAEFVVLESNNDPRRMFEIHLPWVTESC